MQNEASADTHRSETRGTRETVVASIRFLPTPEDDETVSDGSDLEIRGRALSAVKDGISPSQQISVNETAWFHATNLGTQNFLFRS